MSSKCTLFYSSAFWRAFLTTGNTYMIHGPGGDGHIKLRWMTTLHVVIHRLLTARRAGGWSLKADQRCWVWETTKWFWASRLVGRHLRAVTEAAGGGQLWLRSQLFTVPMQGPEGTTLAESKARSKQAQSASLTQEVAKLCSSSVPQVCAGSNGS